MLIEMSLSEGTNKILGNAKNVLKLERFSIFRFLFMKGDTPVETKRQPLGRFKKHDSRFKN